jgi:hypothetical protein
MSYRDFLDRKGIQPAKIERTVKRGTDVVLHSWARPVEIAPGKRGQFAGTMRKAVGA